MTAGLIYTGATVVALIVAGWAAIKGADKDVCRFANDTDEGEA